MKSSLSAQAIQGNIWVKSDHQSQQETTAARGN